MLTMELVEGETLADRRAAGRVPSSFSSAGDRAADADALRPRTSRAWSTATSSPRTSWSRPTASSRSSTSGWRRRRGAARTAT